ncbi:MAG: PhnD/SsuA/transferrin family substrate-binding protein [Bryobacterales bacterium]|nr:PhnD/SsuA/transferrin family substrate-binding protein [Bryobacterales bacterium]
MPWCKTVDNGMAAPLHQTRGPRSSRRQAMGLLLTACHSLPKALAAANMGAPIRLAISESLVSDVSINDARAAMSIWLKRMSQELNIVVEISAKIFDPTPEILRRARLALLDSVALNVIEYRQIADVLDSSQIVAESNAAGLEQYVLLARRSGGPQQLADLRGRRLSMLRGARMCVADAWLSVLLDEGHLGHIDEFFGSVITDGKASRVVLPVFFGQSDACLTSKRGFDTMSELNPQVARDLKALAVSPQLVTTFYAFRKNYRGPDRDRFARVYSSMGNSAAGRQLAALFQFDELVPRDATCLASALKILETADRIRSRRSPGGSKA